MVDELGGIEDAVQYAAGEAELKAGEYEVRTIPAPRTLADFFGGAVRRDIAAGNDLGIFPEGGQGRSVSVGDASGPDDAEPNLAAGHALSWLTFLFMAPRVMPHVVLEPEPCP